MTLSNKIWKVLPNPIDYIIPGGPLISRFLGQEETGNDPSQLWVASLLSEELPGGRDGLSRLEVDGEIVLLKDMILEDPVGFLGEAHVKKYPDSTGILLKLLNSRDRLLVQVHPDTEQAKKYFSLDSGKCEAWYVLDVEEDAGLYLGFKEHVNRQMFRELIDVQDTKAILDCLHRFELKIGDVIIVPPNTPHAMGGNSLVAEIQEQCPITLRAERFRPDGSELPLESLDSGIGIENMLDCFDFTTRSKEETREHFFVVPTELTKDEMGLMPESMKPYFDMHMVTCQGLVEKTNQGFSVGLVLEGSGSIETDGCVVTLKKGEEFFIPNGVKSYQYKSNEKMVVVEGYPPQQI